METKSIVYEDVMGPRVRRKIDRPYTKEMCDGLDWSNGRPQSLDKDSECDIDYVWPNYSMLDTDRGEGE